MANIIVKNYEHFNRSLPNWDSTQGKYIKSKAHYEQELKKAGMKQADSFGKTSEPSRKEYELSQKAREIIREASYSKDKDGKVRLSGRAIEAMKEIGAIKHNKNQP